MGTTDFKKNNYKYEVEAVSTVTSSKCFLMKRNSSNIPVFYNLLSYSVIQAGNVELPLVPNLFYTYLVKFCASSTLWYDLLNASWLPFCCLTAVWPKLPSPGSLQQPFNWILSRYSCISSFDHHITVWYFYIAQVFCQLGWLSIAFRIVSKLRSNLACFFSFFLAFLPNHALLGPCLPTTLAQAQFPSIPCNRLPLWYHLLVFVVLVLLILTEM